MHRTLKAMHSELEGKLVTLRLMRGGKGSDVHKNVLATADGRAIWPAANPLEVSATLYRSDAEGAFDVKEFKLTIEEVSTSITHLPLLLLQFKQIIKLKDNKH